MLTGGSSFCGWLGSDRLGMLKFAYVASDGRRVLFEQMPSNVDTVKVAAYSDGVLVCYISVPDYVSSGVNTGYGSDGLDIQEMVVDVFEGYLTQA